MVAKVLEVWRSFKFRGYTNDIDEGEFVITTTGGAVTPMTAASDNGNFVGVSLTKFDTNLNASGDEVTVMTQGLIKCTLTSAAYAFGAGLKGVAVSSHITSLVADGDADTIAWIHDATVADGSTSITEAIVLIDIYLLATSGANLVDIASS